MKKENNNSVEMKKENNDSVEQKRKKDHNIDIEPQREGAKTKQEEDNK